ncbi:MAG: class I SAM-dependent methyltransferase [Proteobacteria bacterium]|nr:class I SAM-dependent methyltransferase [Pseudomonadota bacterium]
MAEDLRDANDPRWGQAGREAKADAIVHTLRACCGGRLPRGTWLDVGCGSGGIAASLATHADKAVGVDPESWARWSAYREVHANLEFQVGGYRNLEEFLGPESCDVVVCNQVYEHVDDPQALLRAIHAVMKPNGTCYFAGPNLLWPIEPHVFWPFVHWLPRRFAQNAMRSLGSRRANDLDAFSTHYWRLRRWFRESGFAAQVTIGARLDGALVARGAGLRLPRPLGRLIDAMAPSSPGFVFCVRKV